MEHHFNDVDAAYAQGYQDARRDLLNQVKYQIKNFKEKASFIEDLFSDPEKLIAFAAANPEFESAMTTAVVMMLIAEGEKDAIKPESNT